MRKKKKLFFLILVGLLFLTGCSEKEIKDIPEDKGSAVNEPLPAEKAVNVLVSEAEKRESDQHVEDDVYPENKEQNISEEDMPEEHTDWVTIEELNLSYDIFVGLMMSTCNLQSECFWDYGIIKDKGTDTWTSANAEYANLCQEIYGINYEYISENTKEADERRLERDAGYKIVDISEDGGSVLIWQKDSWGSEVHLQIYNNNEKVNELISDELYTAMFFTFG